MLGRRILLVAAGASLGAVLGLVSLEVVPPVTLVSDGAACRIKGNVSVTGERIYHLPGQRYYNVTAINPAKGEPYSCSQWNAWRAGWRKSKV